MYHYRHYGSPSRRGNSCDRGFGQRSGGGHSFNREQHHRNFDSSNTQHSSYRDYSAIGYSKNGATHQQNVGSSSSRDKYSQSESRNRNDTQYMRTSDFYKPRDQRTSPKDREDKSRSISRSKERGHVKDKSPTGVQESTATSRGSQSGGTRNNSAPTTNPWNELLKQKTQEQERNVQRAQRTMEYAMERNKSTKDSSKPTEHSAGSSQQTSGINQFSSVFPIYKTTLHSFLFISNF